MLRKDAAAPAEVSLLLGSSNLCRNRSQKTQNNKEVDNRLDRFLHIFCGSKEHTHHIKMFHESEVEAQYARALKQEIHGMFCEKESKELRDGATAAQGKKS